MSRLPLVILLLAGTSPALARTKTRAKETAPAAAQGAAEAEPPATEAKPRFHPTSGPTKIELGHELALDLPAGMLFLDRKEGKELMESNGNIIGDNFLGLVGQQGSSWLVTFTYWEDGHVKDDDAAHFDAAEILDSIREGNEQANEVRKQRGFKPLAIDGWTEPPRYERGPHHLVWGLKVSDTDSASINFYTRILGRSGYVAINLIDDPARIETSKKEALSVLQATTFRPGARYEDFDSKKDKVAEYGLAALVAGGAGAAALKFAKIGLLAKFGGKLLALIIAGKKLFVVFLLALGAGIKRIFARLTGKKEVAAAPPPPAVDLPPPGELPPPEGPPAQP
jgi:uncharacterized membrane-anchored protein